MPKIQNRFSLSSHGYCCPLTGEKENESTAYLALILPILKSLFNMRINFLFFSFDPYSIRSLCDTISFSVNGKFSK